MQQTNSRPSLKILVADDNADISDSLSLLLQSVGYTVEAVYDGLAAVELAPSFQPDVILLDIGMPRLSGYEAAKQLRKLVPSNVVLVAVTAWGRDIDKKRAYEAGFDHHFVKPMAFHTLLDLLADLAKRIGPSATG